MGPRCSTTFVLFGFCSHAPLVARVRTRLFQSSHPSCHPSFPPFKFWLDRSAGTFYLFSFFFFSFSFRLPLPAAWSLIQFIWISKASTMRSFSRRSRALRSSSACLIKGVGLVLCKVLTGLTSMSSMASGSSPEPAFVFSFSQRVRAHSHSRLHLSWQVLLQSFLLL